VQDSFCGRYLLNPLEEEPSRAVTTPLESDLVNQKALADYIERADAMRRHERFDEAERLLADALAKLGEHPKILISRGWVAYYSGQYEEALKRWSRLRAMAPRDPVGYSAAVAALQKLGRLSEAETIACEGLELFPSNPAIVLNAAWTAHYLRNWNDAAERWHKLASVCPKLPLGYINGAEAYRRVGAFRAAEVIVAEGLKIFPQDHDLRNAHTNLMSRGRKNFRREPVVDDLRATPKEENTLKTLTKLAEESAYDTSPLRLYPSANVKVTEANPEEDGHIDDRSLIAQFLSLGANREFNRIQLYFDVAQQNALDWLPQDTDALALVLRDRLDDASLPEALRIALSRGSTLKQAVLDELKASRKIFLHQIARPIADHELVPLWGAIRSIGHATLMVIQHADERHVSGTVRQISPGLIVGYLSTQPSGTHTIDHWLQVCRGAYALRQQPPTPVPLTIRYGDHLFISGDSNNINGQHAGLVKLPESDKIQWLKLLQARQQELASEGASFLFLLAPDKQTVYRHLLPKTDGFRLAAFLTELPYVVDVAPICAALAHFVDVYPLTDSHWNHLGALMVVQTLLARLGRNLPDFIRDWNEFDHRGDLGSKLKPPESAPRLVAELREQSRLIYDNCVPNNGRVRVWAKPLSACGERQTRLALFGDSFAYDLAHFLKEVFDIVLHVHAFSVDYRLTKVFSPDLVLSEITERFVLRVPNPGDGEPLTVLWQEKVDRRESLEALRDVVGRHSMAFPPEATRIADLAEELFAPFRRVLQDRS
jgi:tetratricopeptide (TPR) repeat protein